jgi:hypothetical protein
MTLKRTLIRTALGLTGFCAVATAVIGVAHTPWGRPLLKLPLLSALASHAGCPVGSIEPADFEKVRRTKLQGDVGTATAKSHPALAFSLGETRRVDIERWKAAEHADCKAGAVASVLECSDVRMGDAPVISKLRLQFDGQERLVSVDLFRSAGTDEALLQRFIALGSELDRKVGPVTSESGQPTAEFMHKSPLQVAMRQHSYSDYVAKAMLLNFGKRGLKLREQYQWLQPGAPRDPA